MINNLFSKEKTQQSLKDKQSNNLKTDHLEAIFTEMAKEKLEMKEKEISFVLGCQRKVAIRWLFEQHFILLIDQATVFKAVSIYDQQNCFSQRHFILVAVACLIVAIKLEENQKMQTQLEMNLLKQIGKKRIKELIIIEGEILKNKYCRLIKFTSMEILNIVNQWKQMQDDVFEYTKTNLLVLLEIDEGISRECFNYFLIALKISHKMLGREREFERYLKLIKCEDVDNNKFNRILIKISSRKEKCFYNIDVR